MKIRTMRARDRPDVIAVYEARAKGSAGLMRRNRARWRQQWPRRRAKNLWLVARDRGTAAGYAAGFHDPDSGWSLEVHWRPEWDGTVLPERLLRELLARIERRDPVAVGAWVTQGSPAQPLYNRLVGHRRPPASVFMAGVVDARALLRDAARIVQRRTGSRLRLRAGRHSLVTAGRGAPVATVSFDPDALLGILLGLRDLRAETRRGTVTIRPRGGGALGAVSAAFPQRRFFIQDAW